MAIIKPEPIQIGGHYLYTLTSYDPVDIEVRVPLVVDEDVEMAFEDFVLSQGKNPEEVDDGWVAETAEGLKSVDELKAALRSQLTSMASYTAEREKADRCVAALATRLGQTVPEQEVARTKASLIASFEHDLQAQGTQLDQLNTEEKEGLAQMYEVIASDAQAIAERDAALAAWASEKKLKVDESEYPELLGISPTDAQTMIEQAKAAGQSEMLKEMVLNAKAMKAVVAECHCTYAHETEAEAKERIERIRTLQAAQAAARTNENDLKAR